MSYQPPEIGIFTAVATYFGYGLLIFLGNVRDFFSRIFVGKEKPPKGYAPLTSDFEDFYTRRLYMRIHDNWNRPINSSPGAHINILERQGKQGSALQFTGKIRRCLNLGSYNYLGFGDPDSPTKPDVYRSLDKFSLLSSSPRTSLGTTSLHRMLEKNVARFVQKEDAMVFSMGFGTNSHGIPSLIGKGGLIVSDSLNHSSIAVGARSSGAKIKVFKHNDHQHLEAVIRRAIVEGQPRTHRPWTKILIIVEGIYSMEGEMCPLKEIIAIKKKYRCYLYVDEAHSIGAIGPNGGGICDYKGVDYSEVDILMGTFSKSFGAVGGYVAGSKKLIGYLRRQCGGSLYSPSISPPGCQQIMSAMSIIYGKNGEGTELGRKKLKQLKDNANFFRNSMRAMGCHVLGEEGSPVVPVMLYNPAKIAAFSRECLKRGLAVVVVGFPAAPLLLGRTRFCISAAHTREDLEDAIKKISDVADVCRIKYRTPLCVN